MSHDPASGDAKTDSKPDTKEALLSAAKKIFAEKGMDRATVKDIADLADVNVSLVSYHFGGKEGLYRACIEGFGLNRLAAAERMLKPPNTLAEFELRLGLFAEEFLITQLNESDLCTILHRDFEAGHPIAMEIFSQIYVKVFLRFRDFVAAAQASGILRPDADPDISCELIFGGLLHMMRHDSLRTATYQKSLNHPAFRACAIENLVKNASLGLAKHQSNHNSKSGTEI